MVCLPQFYRSFITAFIQNAGPSNAQQGHMVRSSHANNSVHSQSEDSTRQVYTFLGDYQVGVMVCILKRG